MDLFNTMIQTKMLSRLLNRNIYSCIRKASVYEIRFKTNSLRRSKTLTVENQFVRMADSATPLHSVPYEVQLQKKHNILEGALRKVVNIIRHQRRLSEQLEMMIKRKDGLVCPFEGVRPSPQTINYRNKEQQVVGQGIGGNLTAGLIVGQGKNIVCVPTDHLKIIKPQHQKISQSFREFLESPLSKFYDGWNGLLIRSNCLGQAMLVVQVKAGRMTEEVLEKVKREVISYYNPDHAAKLGITSLYVQVRNRVKCKSEHHLMGATHIYEYLLGRKFRISPSAFFQQNTAAAEVMYSLVHQIVASHQNRMLLDVGCGVGTIGILMSDLVDKVLGIDMVDSAIDDAVFNAQINDVKNASYVAGTVRAVTKTLLGQDAAFLNDTVAVVNPCRSGLNKKAILRLRGCEAIRQLIYISCRPHGNPLVNFVDLIVPQSEENPGPPFIPVKAMGVDMFPQTVHSELIMVFER